MAPNSRLSHTRGLAARAPSRALTGAAPTLWVPPAVEAAPAVRALIWVCTLAARVHGIAGSNSPEPVDLACSCAAEHLRVEALVRLVAHRLTEPVAGDLDVDDASVGSGYERQLTSVPIQQLDVMGQRDGAAGRQALPQPVRCVGPTAFGSAVRVDSLRRVDVEEPDAYMATVAHHIERVTVDDALHRNEPRPGARLRRR